VQRIDLTAAARRRLLWLAIVVASITGAVPALAADPKIEKEAKELEKKAIEEDNLNVNYPGAIKKLQTAITKCDGDKCNSSLKASLFRDLGAMQVLNGSVDEGKVSFGQSIGMDSSIDLDPAYKNPQLESIWSEVKKHGGAPAGGKTAKAGPQPSGGDFVHTPPTEALVRTPLPLYVEYAGDEELTRVTVKYKAFGMTDWKTLELKKMDTGFGAMIPCLDVQLGLLKYYIQGVSGGETVAKSGARNKPFSVPVTQQISGEPPSLPDQDPPAQCADTGECPPDFPGCGSKKKPGGEDCQKSSECDSNSCVDEKCVDKKSTGDECSADSECTSGECAGGKCAGKKAEGEECESDEECDSNRCKEDKCTASGGGGKVRKVWLGLAVQADIYLLPGANDVCIVDANGSPTNSAGYACTDLTGARFPANPMTNSEILPKVGDQVISGLRVANIRLLLTLDYALNRNMLLGLHAGLVLRTDPAFPAFAPLHLEGRFTYLVGRDALKKTFAPLVFLGVGAGEFDAYVPVTVNGVVRNTKGQVVPNAMGQAQFLSGTDDAWMTAGPVFASVGAGARMAIGSRTAITGALKFEGAFGGAAGFLPGVAPELGVQFGF
jgi:hypothetical protein